MTGASTRSPAPWAHLSGVEPRCAYPGRFLHVLNDVDDLVAGRPRSSRDDLYALHFSADARSAVRGDALDALRGLATKSG
jgi:hypothetical protein